MSFGGGAMLVGVGGLLLLPGMREDQVNVRLTWERRDVAVAVAVAVPVLEARRRGSIDENGIGNQWLFCMRGKEGSAHAAALEYPVEEL